MKNFNPILMITIIVSGIGVYFLYENISYFPCYRHRACNLDNDSIYYQAEEFCRKWLERARQNPQHCYVLRE